MSSESEMKYECKVKNESVQNRFKWAAVVFGPYHYHQGDMDEL